MKYDLSNEDYKEHLETLCLANLPIEFYGEYIRHLTIKEIMLMGQKKYGDLIAPFTFSKEMFNGFQGDFYTLEVLLCVEMREYFKNVIVMLKILFDTDNIKVFKDEIIINDRLFIDKYKFEELTSIILKMSNVQKYKKPKDDGEKKLTLEEINKIEDVRERRYQMRIYEKDKKEQKEKYKSIALYNVYNLVSNSNGVDYDKPLNFNIYQLYNTFGVLHKKENHNYNMRLASSGMVSEVKKLDLRPLSQKIADDK